MHSYESILEQLKSIGIDNFLLPKKELKALPDILSDDEKIHYLVQGMYNGGGGVLCATNNRILFVDKGLLFGLKVEEFPLKKVSSISYETGVLTAEIKIFSSGNSAKITHIDKAGAKSFVMAVRDLTENASIDNQNNNDVIERLERLAELKEKGILSEEEFKIEKSKIL